MPGDQAIVIGAGRFDPAIHKTECRIWPGGEDTWVASKLLEYTIKKHCANPPRIINTYTMNRPMLRRERNPTPFSLVRFWVPELCDMKGRAVYVDADMVVFRDIQELFDAAVGNHRVWRANRESVLVLDCERLNDWSAWRFRDEVDSGKRGYTHLMLTLANEPDTGVLPAEWNCLDSYTPGKTALLHYTSLKRQPWRPGSTHEHGSIWWDLLKEAIKAGAIGESDLKISGIYGDSRLLSGS